MNFHSSLFAAITPLRFFKWTAIGLIGWMGSLILSPYPHYLPPDFTRGFLTNKGSFFYNSGYFIGFYAHIVGAPIALFLGGIQISRSIRLRYPWLHRRIGQVYVAVVLSAAAPGGLIMACKAFGGWSTTICFGVIAIGAWWTTLRGWLAGRRFDIRNHQVWMLRSYVLILSAIFLRLGHFALQGLELTPRLTYQIAAWISWVVPLLALELIRWCGRSDKV